LNTNWLAIRKILQFKKRLFFLKKKFPGGENRFSGLPRPASGESRKKKKMFPQGFSSKNDLFYTNLRTEK
jgi:hypothetical protein